MTNSITVEQLSFYQQNGFLIVKDFFPLEVINKVYDISCDVIDRYAEKTWDGYPAVFQQVHLSRNYHKYLLNFSSNKKLAHAVSTLMNCHPIRIFLDQIICKRPQSKSTLAHQDAPFLSFNDHRSINCWIPLCDVTADMGPITYYQGTHKLGNLGVTHLDGVAGLEERMPKILDFQKIEYDARKGDCFFHNCLTVHSAKPNISHKNRIAYAIQFMPDKCVYNGWEHTFLKPLNLKTGDILIDEQLFPTINHAV